MQSGSRSSCTKAPKKKPENLKKTWKIEEPSTNWKKLQAILQSKKKTGPPRDSIKNGARKRNQTGRNVKQQCDSSKLSDEKTEIWWDNPTEDESGPATNGELMAEKDGFTGLTRSVAMDCEMVGVGPGGEDSNVARVSLVNSFGHCVYDKFVRPLEEVTDHRTQVSGVRPRDLENATEFSVVQKEVADILRNRILVGHALHNDLKVLFIDHPKKKIRDTQKYKAFRAIYGGRPALRKLSEKILHCKIQEGEHDSVQDARAAMRLYTMHRKEWEESLRNQKKREIGDRKRPKTQTHKTKLKLQK